MKNNFNSFKVNKFCTDEQNLSIMAMPIVTLNQLLILSSLAFFIGVFLTILIR
jgi:hypothetical protein